MIIIIMKGEDLLPVFICSKISSQNTKFSLLLYSIPGSFTKQYQHGLYSDAKSVMRNRCSAAH
jgi:hypothetical protein